jgi:hypothetical protein
MMNPILEARLTRGVSRRDFALLTDVSYHEIYAHEHGINAKVSGKLCRGLELLGEDPVALSAKFLEWRQSRRRELLRQAN